MNNKAKFVLGLKYGIVLIVIALLINSTNYFINSFFNSPVQDSNQDSQVMDLIKDFSHDPPALSFIILYIIILAPFVEEVLFRWIPIRTTRFFTNNKIILWSIIIVSSIIFGSLHGDPIAMLIAGIAGLVLSNVFLKGGIISSFTAHTFFNFVGISVVLIHLYFFYD